MLKLNQWGKNPNWPQTIELWTPGEIVPEWLSDRAKVLGFSEKGDIILDTHLDSKGNLHIRDTYRPIDLVVIPQGHYLAYGKGLLKPISPEQLDMLYG